MSHSTEVSVSFGLRTLSITYGSRQIAEVFAVMVHETSYFRGVEETEGALQVLRNHVSDVDWMLIMSLKAAFETEFTGTEISEYPDAWNTRSVLIKHHD